MTKPNFILLTVDTLRADMLGCYGYKKSISPSLDHLAASGARFTQAITGGSWTQAAFPTLLTSTYASMYGGCLRPLSAERPSPVESLANFGYATAGFSTSPLLSPAYGYNRGFNHFLDLQPGESDPPLRRIRGGEKLLRLPITHNLTGLLGMQMRPARLYASASQLTDRICQWLGNNDQPFFVWAHYMDIHWPYHREETLNSPEAITQAWKDLGHLHRANWRGERTTPEQRERYIRLYEEAVVYTDAQIGRLLKNIEEMGLLSNTVIIVVADHGEEFLERAHWGHFEVNLYDEILKVPLIIFNPNSKRGLEVNRQVRTLDLMPTILDLCGCPAPTGMDGISLVPLLTESEGQYNVEESISEMWRDHRHIIAVRTQAFKYIWDSQRPDQPELFDLELDPGERKNVLDKYPEKAKHFQLRVDAHRERLAQTLPGEVIAEPQLDDQMTWRLRDLGYLE
jgi:arylsulfatase A-like enzyme